MKIDNEANFRRLWRALAKADYKNVVLGYHAGMVDYKVGLSINLGVFNDKISCKNMASCPACYEAFKRSKVSMSNKGFPRRLPCFKCPLDWHAVNCEEEGTLYYHWTFARKVKTARKYAKLISKMKWK